MHTAKYLIMLFLSCSVAFTQSQPETGKRAGELYFGSGFANKGQITSFGFSVTPKSLYLSMRGSSITQIEDDGFTANRYTNVDYLIGYKKTFSSYSLTISSGFSTIDSDLFNEGSSFTSFVIATPLQVQIQKVLYSRSSFDLAIGIDYFHYVGIDEKLNGVTFTAFFAK